MGLTPTKVPGTETFLPGLNVCMWDIAFDSSYPTGGETLEPAAVGAGGQTIRGVQIVGADADAAPYHVVWNKDSGKLMVFNSAGFTPAGTNGTSTVTGTAAAQTFTGSALTAHRHVLHFQTSAAANAVTAAANSLRTPAAAFDVAGVANSSGEGGVVDVTRGTPAGTNASSALTATAAAQTFTGSAVAAGALAQVANTTDLSALTVRALIYSS